MYQTLTIDKDIFDRYIGFIQEKFGISFEEINTSILETKINEGLKKTGVSNAALYLQILMNDKTKLTHFVDSITNNLTFFFRNDIHFNTFHDFVLPEIIEKNKESKSIRIWSAGCSTGEEPYSIAMSILRFLGKEIKYWKINIIGTDLSLKAISTAVKGIYLKKKCEKIEPFYIENYMTEKNEFYEINKDVKKLVSFDYSNLLVSAHNHLLKHFDTIFCRNVLIYFNQQTQETALELFYNALKEKSYLFLGHSESIRGLRSSFISKKIGNNYLYYKE